MHEINETEICEMKSGQTTTRLQECKCNVSDEAHYHTFHPMLGVGTMTESITMKKIMIVIN